MRFRLEFITEINFRFPFPNFSPLLMLQYHVRHLLNCDTLITDHKYISDWFFNDQQIIMVMMFRIYMRRISVNFRRKGFNTDFYKMWKSKLIRDIMIENTCYLIFDFDLKTRILKMPYISGPIIGSVPLGSGMARTKTSRPAEDWYG